MPHEWNNLIVVTKEELVPDWYTWASLEKEVQRYRNKSYGIKKVQGGGNGRQFLVLFDSLPKEIQDALGDPRKLDHVLERYYKIDGEAVSFYASFKFPDGSYLDTEYQEKYIINASVLKAVISLRSERENDRKSKGHSIKGVLGTLSSDVNKFQKVLSSKYRVQHTLPESLKRFNEALKAFETKGYSGLISGHHKNQKSRKVFDHTWKLINDIFAGQETKPTATQVFREYDAFIAGYLEVIDNETGELYDPSGYKQLSPATVTNYLAKWQSKIGTYAKRSGNRQTLMGQFRPHHSMDKPNFAGSIISIDDRQPPFKGLDGKRIWFYNGVDLGSEAFTCWVHGDTKEGIILEFYRQLVRNYHEWGVNLPAELEAEMSLNSSFVNTFLREGAMFEHVKIAANVARAKRIERYFRTLRYEFEKDKKGWLARPNALSESNQTKVEIEKIPRLPYNEIVEGCLSDIQKWNNQPHSVHTHMSRWEVFLKMQHPDLKPTNYQSFLPYIGYKEETSCNVGIIRLQKKEFLLGDNGKLCLGDNLIALMKQVEGEVIDIYWLDDNDGNVLKALVFKGTQYICEAVAKPKYNRAIIERTDQCWENLELMSSYVASIDAFASQQQKSISRITTINNKPAPAQTFTIRGLKQSPVVDGWKEPETLKELPMSEEFDVPVQTFTKSLRDRF